MALWVGQRPALVAAFGLAACASTQSEPSQWTGALVPSSPDRCSRLPGATGGPADQQERYRLCLEKACSEKSGAACADLAEIFHRGDGVTPNSPLAALLHRAACDLGDVAGCHLLANMYFVGDGVPPDPARAIAIYDQLCGQGLPAVCHVLGYLYENGLGGLPRDLREASRFYRRACLGGSEDGCRRWEGLLSPD